MKKRTSSAKDASETSSRLKVRKERLRNLTVRSGVNAGASCRFLSIMDAHHVRRQLLM
jgi:hypothetical protein